MDAVVRSVVVYLFLLVILRVSGKRTLSEMTTFDFILLLVIGEATQQALLGQDSSITNAFLVITALVGLDIGISIWKERWPWLEKVIEGLPVIIVEDGRLLQERMKKLRVDEADILGAARRLRGLERLDQVKYAVLEPSGGITIIPKEDAWPATTRR